MLILHILEVPYLALQASTSVSCRTETLYSCCMRCWALQLIDWKSTHRHSRYIHAASTLSSALQEASNALASGVGASAIWRDGRTVNAAVLALQPPPSDDLAAAVPAWAVLADTQTAMHVRTSLLMVSSW